MPRIAKSSRYSTDKKKAINQLNKVELKEALEENKSQLHEVQDLMTVEKSNLKEHNPKTIYHKSARYSELKQIRDTITDDITSINNQIKETEKPVSVTNESVNIGLGVSATIDPFSDEYMLQKNSDTKFENVAQGDILGFREKSSTDSTVDSTPNSAFLNNTFTFGAAKTQVGQREQNTIDQIRARQDHVRQMNAEQRIHHDKVRSGEISPMEALMNPKTVQRIQVQGQADQIFMSAEDRKLREEFDREEYSEAMRQTIIAERIQRQKQQDQILKKAN